MINNGLRALIRNAFQLFPVPPPEAVVYDSSGMHLECAEIMDWLNGRPWTEIGLDELICNSSAIHFFSPEGFVYYGPAWASAACDYDNCDLIADAMVSKLAGFADAEIPAQELIQLDQNQKRAFAGLIGFFKAEYADEFDEDQLDSILKVLEKEPA